MSDRSAVGIGSTFRKDSRKSLKIDDSSTLYDKLIKGINDARENNMACLTMAKYIFPCPNHPRADEFLSDVEAEDELGEKKWKQIVMEELIKNGMEQLGLEELRVFAPCLTLKSTYNVSLLSVGESYSDADRDGKSSRSQTERTVKAYDFIFQLILKSMDVRSMLVRTPSPCLKITIKSVTNFVDIIKVARSPHISFQKKCIEESEVNPIPLEIQDELKLVSIPFFQVIGMKIRFYILIQIDGDLYGIWEWSSQDLPEKLMMSLMHCFYAWYQPPPTLVRKLVNMGFPEQGAQRALKRTIGKIEEALELLSEKKNEESNTQMDAEEQSNTEKIDFNKNMERSKTEEESVNEMDVEEQLNTEKLTDADDNGGKSNNNSKEVDENEGETDNSKEFEENDEETDNSKEIYANEGSKELEVVSIPYQKHLTKPHQWMLIISHNSVKLVNDAAINNRTNNITCKEFLIYQVVSFNSLFFFLPMT
ncbi:7739_t:CDS:2 [Ambispora leptoticha]|uniref:7739_t:CDS:1 n=1 Tax=Ambispora leptoticha TaxID=144679 RepID=A0A9N8WLX9_9GLOM|nr:7739_t:CDS:2 [Ambispora leptoticha]